MRSGLKLLRVSPRFFVIPGILGVGGTVLRLAVLGLFIPLVRVLLTQGNVAKLGRFDFLVKHIAGNHPVPVLFALLFTVTVMRGVCVYISKLVMARKSAQVEGDLSEVILRRHMWFGQQYYDLTRLGTNVNRIKKLPMQVARVLPVVDKIVVAAGSLALYVAAMMLLSWPLAIAAGFFLIAYYIGFRKLIGRLETLTDEADEADDQVASSTQELLTNLPLIKLHTEEETELATWREVARERDDVQRAKRKLLGLVDPLRGFFEIMVLLLFVATCSVLMGSADTGAVSKTIVFFFIMRRAMGSFSDLLNFPSEWSNVRRHVEKMQKVLDGRDKYIVPDGSLRFEGLTDHIVFENLHFAYARKGEVLHGVTFRIRKGRPAAIVGKTGSGKTTIFRLLLRLYDCPPGTISIDGTDIRAFQINSYLSRFAYAGPEPVFFDDTIRRNVTYGLEDVPEERLVKAARQAQALDFIRALENGFDETVGDRGKRLSAGEKQRLALMRVFLRDPDIVLLDEATSALDPETEARISEALQDFGRDKTVVMITHRLAMRQPGMWVVVLENGRVVEEGRRDEPRATGGERLLPSSTEQITEP